MFKEAKLLFVDVTAFRPHHTHTHTSTVCVRHHALFLAYCNAATAKARIFFLLVCLFLFLDTYYVLSHAISFSFPRTELITVGR